MPWIKCLSLGLTLWTPIRVAFVCRNNASCQPSSGTHVSRRAMSVAVKPQSVVEPVSLPVVFVPEGHDAMACLPPTTPYIPVGKLSGDLTDIKMLDLAFKSGKDATSHTLHNRTVEEDCQKMSTRSLELASELSVSE